MTTRPNPEPAHHAPPLRSPADYIELAYGVLWLAPTDKATPAGIALANARQILLDELDQDGKLRGAQAAMRVKAWLRSIGETQ